MPEIGCEFWDDCNTCPFPDCYMGEPGLVKPFWNKQKVVTLLKQGCSPNDIASVMGKSKRTIYRYIKEAKDEQNRTPNSNP